MFENRMLANLVCVFIVSVFIAWCHMGIYIWLPKIDKKRKTFMRKQFDNSCVIRYSACNPFYALIPSLSTYIWILSVLKMYALTLNFDEIMLSKGSNMIVFVCVEYIPWAYVSIQKENKHYDQNRFLLSI